MSFRVLGLGVILSSIVLIHWVEEENKTFCFSMLGFRVGFHFRIKIEWIFNKSI